MILVRIEDTLLRFFRTIRLVPAEIEQPSTLYITPRRGNFALANTFESLLELCWNLANNSCLCFWYLDPWFDGVMLSCGH